MGWNRTNKALSEKLIQWIAQKIEGTRNGSIMIEIKDHRVVSIHYQSSEHVMDLKHWEG